MCLQAGTSTLRTLLHLLLLSRLWLPIRQGRLETTRGEITKISADYHGAPV